MRGESRKSPYAKGHRNTKKTASRHPVLARAIARNIANYQRQIQYFGFIARYTHKPK